MLSKINLYLFRSFFFSFLITFIIFAALIFIGDFIEQFRKSTNKEVPLQIIIQLSSYNFLSLTMFTLPVVSFFSSLFAFLYLIRNSELMEDSKAEAAKQAFAECLLAIPQTLAESAGMDTIDALAALRREPHLGVNVYEKRITEMDDVREPYLMTKASINAAVETAITLLRTDEVILSKPIQETFVDDML